MNKYNYIGKMIIPTRWNYKNKYYIFAISRKRGCGKIITVPDKYNIPQNQEI